MTALLMVVLIIVTIISTLQTRKMAGVAREQIDNDKRPSVLFVGSRQGIEGVFYNNGKYPLLITDFYASDGKKLDNIISISKAVFAEKVDAFSSKHLTVDTSEVALRKDTKTIRTLSAFTTAGQETQSIR